MGCPQDFGKGEKNMAFCTNCGSELAEGAKFCENCGTPVAVETVTETAIVEAEPAFEESTPVETPVYVAVNDADDVLGYAFCR